MINFDANVKEKVKEHHSNRPQSSDNQYRILTIGGSRSGKTNSLFNLINQQPDIDQIYLYDKDPYKAKFQFLINKKESRGLTTFNDSKTFIEYLNLWMIFIKTLKNTIQIRNVKH